MKEKKEKKVKEEKIKYVSANVVDKIDANVVILLGERTNGKSFAIKELMLKHCYKDKVEFAYIRRNAEDVKDYLIGEYFTDIIANKNGHNYVKEWTNGEYSTIVAYRKSIYFANVDPETEKVTRGQKIGRMFGLSVAEHYKSLSFPNIKYAFFEEWVTNRSYLPNEPKELLNLISTIFRLRTDGRLFCIGNKVSRVNPYMGEWGLVSIMKQRGNTVDYYTLKDNDGNETRVASYMTHTNKFGGGISFGNASKAIRGGEWETDEQPHLHGHRDDYALIYSLVFKYDYMFFLCEFLMDKDGNFTWFVTPKTTPIQPHTRIVANTYHINKLATIGFVGLNKQENLIFKMLSDGKVCFADNLTGTEFKQCYRMTRGIVL